MVRKRFVFHGRVQGVGFRFTAIKYANSLGLTGWVKNQYDGTVLMEVQGILNNINRLIYFLNNDTYIRIDFTDEIIMDTKENEIGFGLR